MINNLVIGSDGFIGEHFCKYLSSLGEGVVRFDIKRGLDEDARSAKFPLDNVDRVYFLAWDVGGAKYLYDPNLQHNQLIWNTKLLLNTIPQLEKAKKPFLFISSQLAEENDTVYGATKRLGEVWTKISNGFFVRQWNVYGPIEKSSIRSHVVSDFVVQAVTSGEIKMITTGEEVRQFIHVSDVSKAWHKVLSEQLRGVYDVTSFEWVKIIDIAKLVSSFTGAKIIPGNKVGSTPLTPMSGKIPGWSATMKLEDGIKQMVEDAKKIF